MQQLTSCPICDSTSTGSFIKTTAQMHSDKEVFNFDQCANCQLVYLNPRVSLEQLKNYYTSHYLPYRGAKGMGKVWKIGRKQSTKVRFKTGEASQRGSQHIFGIFSLRYWLCKPSFLMACQKELKCDTMGIDFSDEGWKEQSNHFDGVDLQVAE